MRNNMNRMGIPTDGPAHDVVDTPNIPPQQNEETAFIVATELVDLPSKGLFYDESHPLHHETTIEIKHMTTKEEDILTNQSFLKNGTAIDRMLQSIIVNKAIKVKDLFIGDKNALLVASRIYGYGPDYTTKFSCPSCGASQQATFDLHDMENINFEDNQAEYNIDTDYESKTLFLEIPRTKTKLGLRLIKEDIDSLKKNKSKGISSYYKKIIKSVNGNTNPKYILSYIDSMSALDSRYLRNIYYKIVPGVDFAVHFECEHCGFESQVEVPLNAEFFGLSDKYIKNVYEQFFYMKYHAGWGIYELYHLPIGLRSFYIQLLIENKEKEKQAYEKAQGTHRVS